MIQRSVLLVVALIVGALGYQRDWWGFGFGLAIALWLVFDNRAIESLDADRVTD